MILRKALLDGPAWEDSTGECLDRFVAAAASKTKFTKKRMGAKAVKQHELLENTGDVLTDLQSTTFRALAARANYLALDRPDVAYAAKELCRSFARPTSKDVESLRRLVRYRVHAPRIAYRYAFEKPCDKITVCVDTDFAGCVKTRRSTSGGMVFWVPI